MSMLETLLDPERRATAAREQDKLREKHGGRIQRDPAIVTFYWGQQREQVALQALEETDPGKHSYLLEQLAEGLAAQARFAEAGEITQNAKLRLEYQAKAAALDAAGERWCDCPTVKIHPDPYDAKGRSEASPKAIQRVYDGEQLITITRCLHCNMLSAE